VRTVPVEEVQVGDVLAEDQTDGQGKVLLPKGARLSVAAISLLRRRGVTAVTLEGEEVLASEVQSLLEALEVRFAGLEDDPVMMQLKSIARGHLLRQR
jgi:hypothetical protein